MTDKEFDNFFRRYFFLAPTTPQSVNALHDEMLIREFTHKQQIMLISSLSYLYPTMDVIYEHTENPFNSLIEITDQWEAAWIDFITNYGHKSQYVYFGNNEYIKNLSTIVK